MKHYIVIVGCGRLGSLLANHLSGKGNNVVVIDRNHKAFERLSTDFSGYRIVGDATEQSVLREANISEADFCFSATQNDNINLMVAQIARTIFEVPHVLARISDPAREAIYREFGIQTISPTQLTADAFLKYMKATEA